MPNTSEKGLLYSLRYIGLYAFCYAFLSPGVLLADSAGDNWIVSSDEAQSATTQHAPDNAQNRIIKWCQEGGNHTRYASANIELNGYKPCGQLETTAACDASGNRLIGKSPQDAHGYRDCGTPRIFISNYSEDDVVDTSEVFQPQDDKPEVEPLSGNELQNLKRDFSEAKNHQAQDPAMALQAQTTLMLQYLVSQMGGIPSDPSNPGKVGRANKTLPQFKNNDPKVVKKRLDEMLQGLDPQTRSTVEQLLKQTP